MVPLLSVINLINVSLLDSLMQIAYQITDQGPLLF